jgi:hypothetical protein
MEADRTEVGEKTMSQDEEAAWSNERPDEEAIVGSDELLADDHLRLPESASALMRLHAVRAWLVRRLRGMEIEVGEATLALQLAVQETEAGTTSSRLRRRSQQYNTLQRAQQTLSAAQERLHTYEEAQALFEECVDHTTAGERVLVEYYLTLDNLLQDLHNRLEQGEAVSEPHLAVLADVLHRVEHVGIPEAE